jgi:hypothetical protein
MKRWWWPLILAACAGGTSSPTASHDATADVHADAGGSKPIGRKLFVLDTVLFTRVSQGVAKGFDLDGKTSTADDSDTCNKADFKSPDGASGIDNQFATLVPLIEQTGIAAVEKLLQASIESGGILLGIELNGVDDLYNDAEVTVHVRAGYGLPLLGTDGRLLTGQTFHVSPRDPAALAGKASIKDGVLDVGPFDVDLPVQVFGNDYTLAGRGARVRFRIVDGSRIEAGVLGAGITLTSLQKIAETATQDQGDILETVTLLLAGQGDLAKDATGTCQQLSAALEFTGVSGYFYPDEWTPTAN